MVIPPEQRVGHAHIGSKQRLTDPFEKRCHLAILMQVVSGKRQSGTAKLRLIAAHGKCVSNVTEQV
jgi:hypothetical protein